jgi:hypothetical protein
MFDSSGVPAASELEKCPGSGKPVFLDYVGPVAMGLPKCSGCNQPVMIDSVMNAGWHRA